MSDDFNEEQELDQKLESASKAPSLEQALASSPDVVEELTQEHTEAEEVHDDIQLAKTHGHLSKDEYLAKKGTLEGYKDEKSFNAYGELYPEIKSLRQELSKRNSAIDALVEAQKQTALNAVNQARLELEYKLQKAKEHGDIDGVAAFTEAKTKLAVNEQRAQAEKIHAEIETVNRAFLERNKHWYGETINPGYTQQATTLGSQIMSNNPSLSYAQVAKQVEDTMVYLHPELMVSNTPRQPITSTKSAINKSTAGSSINTSDDKMLSKLSEADRWEYDFVRRATEGIKDKRGRSLGIKVSVQDFINSKNKKQRSTKDE